jgi:hypothetical protein
VVTATTAELVALGASRSQSTQSRRPASAASIKGVQPSLLLPWMYVRAGLREGPAAGQVAHTSCNYDWSEAFVVIGDVSECSRAQECQCSPWHSRWPCRAAV